MRIGRYAAAWFAVACCGLSTTVSGQTRTLTLTDVMTRAREQAPLIVSARLALEATRGRLLGASLRQQSNPELDARLGNRSSTSGRFTDMQLSVTQAFEPGGRRSARIAGAAASIDQADATVDETVRSVLRGAAGHYYRALHAAARIHLLDDTEALAARALSVAERRFRAGDVAVLDVNIARASLGRARAERETAQAVRERALGDLKTLLGIDDGIVLAGALVRPDDVDLAALLDTSARRPELRALEAAVREAEADVDFGRTLAKPAYGAVAQYGREEGDRVILGGLTVTLPVFSNGQELRATGATRAVRSRAELAAARTRVQLEVRTAFDTYSRRLTAVHLLETDALPSLDENQTLATRSFDVGQLGLPELLVIRREIVDTRALYLDALLEAALARVDLDASASRLP